MIRRMHTARESDHVRNHALECMRLAADCMQLVGDVQNPALQRHFLRMAGVWRTMAEQGPDRGIAAGPRITAHTVVG
jgi:hypothetical protein